MHKIGKIFPLLFFVHICSLLNTWKLDINSIEYVIHSIFKPLTYANSINSFFVRGTKCKIAMGYLVFLLEKHICIYHLFTIINSLQEYFEAKLYTIEIIINNKVITVCRCHSYYHAKF